MGTCRAESKILPAGGEQLSNRICGRGDPMPGLGAAPLARCPSRLLVFVKVVRDQRTEVCPLARNSHHTSKTLKKKILQTSAHVACTIGVRFFLSSLPPIPYCNHNSSSYFINSRPIPIPAMMSNKQFILITCLAALNHQATAFSHSSIISLRPPSTAVSTTGTSSSLFASIAPNEEKSDNNPSTKFGSPLSDTVKDINRFSVGFLKGAIFDTVFAGKDRDIARFYALETIARVPYFSYLSVLHVYETLGKWRRAKYLKLHFAESWNELHHLLIMEELGGADKFFDRFLAQHIAFGYYAVVIALYLINPVEAYNLNEDVEEHAYSTYRDYLIENEEMLKGMPAPQAAIDYYVDGDMYMFDEFQTDCELRRPKIENLYDVFVAIRDDEAAHVNTMKLLQTELDVSSIHDGECAVDIF